MKTLLGVDLAGTYRSAAKLGRRFGFPDQEIHLLNVVEPMPSTGWFAPTGYVPPSWDSELQAAGKAVLESLAADFASQGIQTEQKVVFGQSGDALLIEADRIDADLVAIGSSSKNRLECVLVGSVGRSLAIASKHSVLIARGSSEAEGPLRIVFGTDHSDYANRCLEKFLSWRPRNLESIHRVTAVHLEDWEQSVLADNIPQIGGDPVAWLEEQILQRSAVVASRLCAQGYQVHTHVQRGRAIEVLHHSMRAFHGNVLAVGGQGHGFVERLVLGSVALHQAVAEKYPVLILRA